MKSHGLGSERTFSQAPPLSSYALGNLAADAARFNVSRRTCEEVRVFARHRGQHREESESGALAH
jgi:hypothetical protein